MSSIPSDDAGAAGTSERRPLTGGAVMGTASRLVVAVAGSAMTILVARLLGPEGAGNFAIALTVIFVLTVLTTLGVEHGVAYYVSSGRWGAAHAFATTQRVALGIGSLGAVLGVAGRLVVPSAFGDLTVAQTALVAGALPFALAWFYGSYVALAGDHYEAFVVPPAVQSLTLLVLGAGLILAFGISGALAALAASHVVVAGGLFVWSRRQWSGAGEPEAEPGQLRRALAFGIKGYAANALQILNYRVDFFILSVVASTAALGHYSVAVAVTTVMWLLPQALSDVLFPRVAALSASAKGSAAGTRAFVEAKSLRHTTLLVLVSVVALALALIILVVPIFGPGFEESVALGLIRLPGVALLGVGAIMSATIVGRGHPEYGLYTALISTPVTIALYAALIPSYKATGAALASSISFAINFALTILFYRRLTHRPVLPLLVPGLSELDDYRQLVPKIRGWLLGLRRETT
jgi:O-antigen/teichoic acid export membrane protein